MDQLFVKKGLDFTRKNKKLLLLLAASGFSGYGLHKFYNLPAIAQKRKRVLKFFGALNSIAEAISDSAETFGLVSKDLKAFLNSDSDQIPNSFKQISRITNSNKFSESVIIVTQALTRGFLRGYRSQAKSDEGASNNPSFEDRVFDKLFTTAGSGFVSVVVGSFTRNLVMAFYTVGQSGGEIMQWNSSNSIGTDHLGLENNSIPGWLNVVCGNEKCRELIKDYVQLFVSTAVAVYHDKALDMNTDDGFFTALTTNPKHETKVREVIVSVCNGAVETLIKTSHQVLTRRKKHSGEEAFWAQLKARNSSTILAVASNRKFILDVSGRVAFEMVRSFIEILLEKLFDGIKTSVDVVNAVVFDKCLEILRYVTARISVAVTVCVSLCLHFLDGPWILAPS